jgi:AcrR family transcriptional regulator
MGGQSPIFIEQGVTMPRLAESIRNEVQTETRRRLLEAAAAEFAEKGFAGANINRISRAAGFAKGTIYNYFSSKRALMLALIDEVAANHTQFIACQVEEVPDPASRLHAFFQAGFAFVEQFPLQARLAIATVFGHDDTFRERIFDAYIRLFALVDEEILKAGISAGDYGQMDTDMTTALVMSLYLGSCSLLGSDGRIGLDPEQVARFVIEGIRPLAGGNGRRP